MPPNPPPIRIMCIVMFDAGIPTVCAISVRPCWGVWLVDHTVSFPVAGSMSATVPQVSNGAGCTLG